MDRFFSYFAVPIGIVICFGPALVAWVLAELKSPRDEKQPAKK